MGVTTGPGVFPAAEVDLEAGVGSFLPSSRRYVGQDLSPVGCCALRRRRLPNCALLIRALKVEQSWQVPVTGAGASIISDSVFTGGWQWFLL